MPPFPVAGAFASSESDITAAAITPIVEPKPGAPEDPVVEEEDAEDISGSLSLTWKHFCDSVIPT